jgi:hypothetical protein
MSPGFFTGAMAFLLTLMVLSYLIGDNPLFRIAVYVFVGVAAGYVAAVAFWQVLYPDLIVPLVRGTSMQRVTLAVPLLLIGLLLMKAWPGLTRLGMPAMGLLFPQVQATIDPFSPQNLPFPDVLFNGAVVLAGVVATLAYFHFGARTTQDGSVRRLAPVEMIAAVGSIFVAITLGMLFAGVYSAALTAMIERLHFLASFVGLG